jgi:hypothetical protein
MHAFVLLLFVVVVLLIISCFVQAHNRYTQLLLDRCRSDIPGFLGFVMHGGISGGGCGFLFEPDLRDKVRERGC